MTFLPTPVTRRIAAGITLIGIVLFGLSVYRPWWGLIMYAPQYPSGLETVAGLRSMDGDVSEIDELNHYIGMMKLGDAASLERDLAPYLVWLFSGMALTAIIVRRRLANWVLRIPIIIFPLFFLADLQYWLWYAGNHLDPRAPLSAAIKGFTPVMLGAGQIAQFRTYGWLEPGFWLAASGSLLVLLGGWAITQPLRRPTKHCAGGLNEV